MSDIGELPAPPGPQQQTFGEWVKAEMNGQGLSINALAEKAGMSGPGLWNILNGNTRSPRPETRARLAAALREEIPQDIEAESAQETAIIPGYEWGDFTPSDLETIPESPGVYVFYDVTDRPVYVGKSRTSVRGRVRDHQTRFWFKYPVVARGAFLAVNEPEMCAKIEMILIKFLGKHALLNTKGAVRDFEE